MDNRALTALMTSSLVINDTRPSAFHEYRRPGSCECLHFIYSTIKNIELVSHEIQGYLKIKEDCQIKITNCVKMPRICCF